MTAYRTIVVPAPSAQQYRDLAATWQTGEGMLITPLYTYAGTETVTLTDEIEGDYTVERAVFDITHYISTGAIGSDVAALLNDPAAFVEEINARTGGSMTESEAQALRDSMELVPLPESGEPGAETVNETLDRLGLQRQPVETEL